MFLDNFVTIFARAGGGGSSSGDAEAYLFAIPAITAGGAANFVKKKTKSKPFAFVIGSIVGAAVSTVYLIGGVDFFIFALIIAISGSAGGAFADRLAKFRKNNAAAQIAAQHAATNDPMWNPEYVTDYAKQSFMRFQHDWGNFDIESIRQYTTQRYADHVSLMLYALQQMGRKNIMENIKIDEIILTHAFDDTNNQGDRVSVGIAAQAKDSLIETSTGKQLTVSNEEFGEQWNFVRDGNLWRLDSIDQGTEGPSMLVQSLKAFAESNQMYFSPDWGRLLLPRRGQLFKDVNNSLVKSDVNNHVIGYWDGNLLVQLYTYSSRSGKADDTNYYMVGQVNLPKSYGGILIERRSQIFNRIMAPRGYKKITLEWGDFNQRYSVYATDENQVTSFELLNPGFMAWLYDQDLKVNIEVVDNVVYLYSKISAGEQRYVDMLEILKRGHKELKM